MDYCFLCGSDWDDCDCDLTDYDEADEARDGEPFDIDGGELSFDPYAGCAIYGEDTNDCFALGGYES